MEDFFSGRKSLLVLIYVTIFYSCIAHVHSNQNLTDYMSEYLEVKYNVLNNLGNNGAFHDFQILLKNSGSQPIPDGQAAVWQMYFCNVRLIEPDKIRDGGVDLGHGLRAYHVAGCLHKIEPTASFEGIGTGQSLDIRSVSQYWHIARTDAMPNWYITSDGSEPRVLASTVGESLEFMGPHDTPEKWKRTDGDRYDPYTGQDRYNMRDYTEKEASGAQVIPTLMTEDVDFDRTLNVKTGDWVVVDETDNQLEFEANYLAEKLGTVVLPIEMRPVNHYISLKFLVPYETEGEYHLTTDQDSATVVIEGSEPAGVFYAIQTLLSLADEDGELPVGQIRDQPRFQYRGMHVDVGRHFHDKDKIMGLIELMAMYKLNVLHFHITDDEGWRLEIPGLPELTEVGSRQCHDPSGDQCIAPQLGSGPLPNNEGTGHYTVDDYKEILRFAGERHVRVIPEFDMPGHAHAAIHAMLARYRKYKDTDMEAATEYLLTDLDDKSEYISVQYFTDNAINPCMASTYTFVEHVVREVKDIHEDAEHPLTVFHFGGDEVPVGAWVNSTACHDQGLDKADKVKEWFIANISKIAAELSLDLAGWEDGYNKNAPEIFGRDELPNENVYSYTWDNVWEWGGGQNAYMFANANYSVILSHATHLYFDHPYEPDPEERGYYWATRWSDTRKTFGYMPDSVYDNIDVDRMGNPLNKEELCANMGCVELEDGKRPNIIGMQGHLWSETVRQEDQMDYMIFPRLLALAERAWHQADWESVTDSEERNRQRTTDWERFTNMLGHKELSRLDRMNVMYAVSPPGVRVTEAHELDVKAEFPGLPVQYSYDAGVTWTDYKPGMFANAGEVHVITRSADRSRASRPSIITVEEQETSRGGHVHTSTCAGVFLTVVVAFMFVYSS